jgi:hypothetical protein
MKSQIFFSFLIVTHLSYKRYANLRETIKNFFKQCISPAEHAVAKSYRIAPFNQRMSLLERLSVKVLRYNTKYPPPLAGNEP